MNQQPSPPRASTEDATHDKGSGETASRAMVALRLVLLLAVGTAAAAAFLVDRWHERGLGSIDERYVCAMHPQVVATKPGECPICRMALTRVELRSLGPATRASAAPGATTAEDAVSVLPVKTVVFPFEVRAPAWVESAGVLLAHVYNDDLPEVGPEETGSFAPAGTPKSTTEARLDVEPPAAWDRSTSRVHFRIDPAVAVGAVGWLRFPIKQHRALLLPYSAVLQSPAGPYVLSAGANDSPLSQRPVRIGKVFYGNAVVVSGVDKDERVAMTHAFFVDADLRLHAEDDAQLGVGR